MAQARSQHFRRRAQREARPPASRWPLWAALGALALVGAAWAYHASTAPRPASEIEADLWGLLAEMEDFAESIPKRTERVEDPFTPELVRGRQALANFEAGIGDVNRCLAWDDLEGAEARLRGMRRDLEAMRAMVRR